MLTVGIVEVAVVVITAVKIGADLHTNKSTGACLSGTVQYGSDMINKTLSEEK